MAFIISMLTIIHQTRLSHANYSNKLKFGRNTAIYRYMESNLDLLPFEKLPEEALMALKVVNLMRVIIYLEYPKRKKMEKNATLNKSRVPASLG